MKRTLLFPLILLFVLAACAPDGVEPPNVTAVANQPVTALNEPAAAETAPPTGEASPTSETATSAPSAEVDAASSNTAEPPTPKPVPSATLEIEVPQVISGQTAEGAFFLGAPDAPLTVIDYSDFL